MAPRVIILRAAGTNCDRETEFAWQCAGAAAERVHLKRLLDEPALLDRAEILTIPGGFSYGDDIAAGRIFAAQLDRRLGHELRAFVESGRLILGICNGFQVLVQLRLLPGAVSSTAAGAAHAQSAAANHPGSARLARHEPAAASAAGSATETLTPPGARRTCSIAGNEPPGFQDRWVCLRAGDEMNCVMLEPGRTYEMPIAHGEGRVVFAGDDDRDRIARAGRDALTYIPVPWNPRLPANPNGSDADIAGLTDETGRVLGLMPHPERFAAWTQHPCWTSLPEREPDGLRIFQRAVQYFA